MVSVFSFCLTNRFSDWLFRATANQSINILERRTVFFPTEAVSMSQVHCIQCMSHRCCSPLTSFVWDKSCCWRCLKCSFVLYVPHRLKEWVYDKLKTIQFKAIHAFCSASNGRDRICPWSSSPSAFVVLCHQMALTEMVRCSYSN